MATQKAHLFRVSTDALQENSIQVGVIVRVKDNGEVFVDYPENRGSAIKADVLSSAAPDILDLRKRCLPYSALIFVNAPRPVVVGLIQKDLTPEEPKQATIADSSNRGISVDIDGKRLMLESQREIILRCGKSSITLNKNGKIILRGVNLTSRASEANKIKGATVKIN